MSNFNDSEEKEYTRRIIALLEEYKVELLAADPPLDPTQRILNLKNGAESADRAETAITRAEQALKDAIALANKLREDNYKLAQASVGLFETGLGKSSPAAEKARGIRSEITSHPRESAGAAPNPVAK